MPAFGQRGRCARARPIPARRWSAARAASSRGGDQRRLVGVVHRPDQRRVVRALAATERCGPSRCRPRKPGTLRRAAPRCRPPRPRAVTSGVSVISVGSSAVVPKRAWARADRADGLDDPGRSLSMTPPPPLTCRSTKPGHERAVGIDDARSPAGSSPRRRRQATACRREQAARRRRAKSSPSKMRRPVMAYGRHSVSVTLRRLRRLVGVEPAMARERPRRRHRRRRSAPAGR